MGRKKKYPNLIQEHSKKIAPMNLQVDIKVFLAIVVSIGCRPSEAQEYEYIQRKKDVVMLKIPIKKKEEKSYRTIPVEHALFGLRSADFKNHSGNMKSLKTYNRWIQKILGRDARTYRHEFAIFLLRNTNVKYVQSALCHSDIRTTQIYLDAEKADFNEIRKF